MEFNNNEIKRKVPINRNNLFFSEESFQFETDLVKEYLEMDMNQKIVLYQVDLTITNTDDIYHEAKKDSIRFKTPIEIYARYVIEDAELQAYDTQKQLGVYNKPGTLKLWVLDKTLLETNSEIRRGDYIGVQVSPEEMIYFSVAQDGKTRYDNKHTMYGTKMFYRTITASYVDKNEFQGR